MKPLILLLGLFGLVFQGQAQDTGASSPIIFIYDASGSMWGQMAGQTKMEIASSVLTQTVNKLPENQQIGLVAYGHRNKSDCKDVEFLVDVDGGSKTLVNQALAAVKPLGKTPLAWSATQVIDKLRSSGQKATIILVTDGIESCGGNICEIIAAAKKEGIDFKLHIVGFGLKDSETEQLKCAAQAGQGNYYDAADAGALSEVLNKATEATVDAPAGNFTVYASKNDQPIDALVSAFKAGTKEKVDAIRTYRDTVFLRLPAGRYDLKAAALEGTQINPAAIPNIESFDDSVAHQAISFDAAKLQVNALNNGEGWDTSVQILGKDGKRAGGTRTYGQTRAIEIDPGTYDVELAALAEMSGTNTTHVFKNVELVAGETKELEHNFETGVLMVGAKNGKGMVDASVNIIEATTDKRVSGGRTYTTEKSNPRKFILNPGIYNVQIKAITIHGSETSKLIENVNLKTGETYNLEHHFPTATVKLGAQTNGELADVLLGIYSTDRQQLVAGSRTYASENGNPRAYLINPGTYAVRLRGQKEGKDTVKWYEFTVKEGEAITQLFEW